MCACLMIFWASKLPMSEHVESLLHDHGCSTSQFVHPPPHTIPPPQSSLKMSASWLVDQTLPLATILVDLTLQVYGSFHFVWMYCSVMVAMVMVFVSWFWLHGVCSQSASSIPWHHQIYGLQLWCHCPHKFISSFLSWTMWRRLWCVDYCNPCISGYDLKERKHILGHSFIFIIFWFAMSTLNHNFLPIWFDFQSPHKVNKVVVDGLCHSYCWGYDLEERQSCFLLSFFHFCYCQQPHWIIIYLLFDLIFGAPTKWRR